MENFKKVHGCLLGVMIGDALGAPVEMMKPEDILAQTDQKGIVGFDHKVRRKQFRSEAIIQTPQYSARSVKIPFFNSIKAWIKPNKNTINFGLARENLTNKESASKLITTTDDWQLTDAVCRSLIRRGKFDIIDIALSHVEAYETSTSGWGGTTRDGMKDLQDYFGSRGHKGRSPVSTPLPVPGKGSGNGIAMKVSPLALMHCLKGPDYESLATEVADLGRLTHSDPRAWAAAYAVACTLLESHKTFDIKDKSQEAKLDVLENVLHDLSSFERKYGSGGLKRFSSYLKVLLDKSLLFGPIQDLREKVGTGCIAIESVVFALAIFLRNPFDFETVVLEAVNSGGDTDSTSSIAGGLCGFIVGAESIPSEWKYYSSEFNKAEQVAKEFYNTFSMAQS